MSEKNEHVIWHEYLTRSDRNRFNRHKNGVVWFTGLSAAGKSTIAHELEKAMFERNIQVYVLDGDNVRHGLNANLGFSPEDRKENLRRIVEVSRLFLDAGIIVLAAFISPYRSTREQIRKSFDKGDFIEVYVKCSLEECEKRDPKGQYKKARAGVIKNYTGISDPYEEPEEPELVIDTEIHDIKSSTQMVLDYLEKRDFFSLTDKPENK